jgi:hypothetical protein
MLELQTVSVIALPKLSVLCSCAMPFNRALRQQPPLIKAALNGGNLRNLGRIVRYKLS